MIMLETPRPLLASHRISLCSGAGRPSRVSGSSRPLRLDELSRRTRMLLTAVEKVETLELSEKRVQEESTGESFLFCDSSWKSIHVQHRNFVMGFRSSCA